jgi:hypothetical protein
MRCVERYARFAACWSLTPSAWKQDGRTALMLSVQEGHTKVAALLLKNGAKLEATDKARACVLDGLRF